MPIIQYPLEHLVVAHWGLAGSSVSTQPGYRSQNPWQALEHYMELRRGNSAKFFRNHGAKSKRIDRGGSVWRIVLETIPTPSGLAIDEFAQALIDELLDNFSPVKGDQIFVSYASSAGFGQLEWTP